MLKAIKEELSHLPIKLDLCEAGDERRFYEQNADIILLEDSIGNHENNAIVYLVPKKLDISLLQNMLMRPSFLLHQILSIKMI